MFYYLKKINLLQGYPCCVITGQHQRISEYKSKFGNDVYEYENEYLPVRVLLDKDSIIIPTQNKLKELDVENYILPENYYYDSELNILEKPLPPDKILKPEFIEKLGTWFETATAYEIEQHEKSIKIERLQQLEKEIQIELFKLEKSIITEQEYENLLIEFNTLDLEINPL